MDTLPETNIAPENRPFQKETSIPTIHFQVRNVSFRVDNTHEFPMALRDAPLEVLAVSEVEAAALLNDEGGSQQSPVMHRRKPSDS